MHMAAASCPAFLSCLQTTARRNSIPIDSLSFEYSVVNIDERELQQPPKEGVYIKVGCLPSSCTSLAVMLNIILKTAHSYEQEVTCAMMSFSLVLQPAPTVHQLAGAVYKSASAGVLQPGFGTANTRFTCLSTQGRHAGNVLGGCWMGL